MSRLSDYGIIIERLGKKQGLYRSGRSIAITPLQRDMLDWLDMTGTPTRGCCCDTLWEQVDEKWVRGQWDKLGSVMLPLGVIAAIDDADTIGLHAVDAEGCPVAPVREDQPAAGDAPDHAEIISSLQDEIKTLRQMIVEEAALRVGAIQRLKVAEQERDEAKRFTDQVRDNSALLNELEQARARIAELEAAQAQPSAEVVQLRDYPVRIAPRYLTVAVSEPLFRWLEAAGDRNRRSADEMARALLLAFMRSTGNREAA